MEHEEHMLSAQQYYELYCKTFACLDVICAIAEESMRELEELQLSMAEEVPFTNLFPFPSRKSKEEET